MPGRCPSCNQTYTDETLSFCPDDGTPLIKETYDAQGIKPPTAYDPQATIISQPPPTYPPQPPGYYAPQGGQSPPPGGSQPPPYDQQQYGQQQQQYGQQPYNQQQQYPPQYGAPVSGKSKLPLILAIVAVLLIGGGVAAYFLIWGGNSSTSTSNTNSSTTNSNKTSRATDTTNTRTTTTTFPTPTTTTTTTTTTSSTSSEDEKYRLFYAATKVGDQQLQKEIARKIGIIDTSGSPTPYYQTFVKGAGEWGVRDSAWVQTHNTPEAARAWVNTHN